jgi:hypothetical protein
MAQFRDYLRDPGYFRAVRTKIGDELSEQHDLTEPLPHSLLALLKQLEPHVEIDDTGERLYAAVEKSLEAMVRLDRRHTGKNQEP